MTSSDIGREEVKERVAVTWFFDLALREGIDRSFLAETTGLDARRLVTEPHELDVSDYLLLFEDTARHAGDPELGLRLGERAGLSDFGLLGYLAANAPSVRDLCSSVSYYCPIFSRAWGIEFGRTGGRPYLGYREARLDGRPAQQDVAFTMAFMANQLRLRTREEWTPSFSSFSYPRPDGLETHRRIFGPNLEFGAPQSRMVIEESLMRQTIDGADPGLFAVLRQQADSILASFQALERSPFSDKVKVRLAAGLGGALPSAEDVAVDLDVSVRQLHRLLTNEGTTFRALRDETVHAAAREALALTDSKITEIALHLGYSETSAFTRAFKRMQGASPVAFRRSLRARYAPAASPDSARAK
ncbi:MAG: AraC family transcriptional regulator [Myxococcota bacterium]